MYPLGSLSFLCQQIAAGRDGYLTRVGLETYLDPRQTGGKLNAVTKEDLVSLVHLNGQEHIWYKAFPIDIAIIRGTAADQDGNLSLEEEALTMNVLYQAMAARRHGGTVIAQVKRVVPAGSIHPRLVAVPGLLVDAVVVAEDQRVSEAIPDRDWLRQNDRIARPPTGVLVSNDAEVWRAWLVDGVLHPKAVDDPYPLSPDKIIGRRAAFELRPGDVVNVGAGLPMREINPVAIEEEVEDQVDLTSEAGAVGGIFNGAGFRSNVTYHFSTPDIFSYYQAGLIPTSYLSMLEDRKSVV
jgi:propionate CoA-transferase